MSTLKIIIRYSASRYNRHRLSSVKIALSFALSLAVIMIILSVMAALQQSRFSAIRDIKSFDILIENGNLSEIEALYPDARVFAYKEGYALLDGSAYIIRYIDESYDGRINIIAGDESGLLVPYSLYTSSFKREYDYSSVERRGGRSVAVRRNLAASGAYYTGLSDFDSSYAFLPLSDAPEDARSYVAVKGSEDVLPLDKKGISYSLWKDREATLYSAFSLENFLMLSVLIVLLLVVYVEIIDEARTFLRHKKNERIELEIMGMGRKKTVFIFICSFLLILFSGALCSIALSETGVFLFSLYLAKIGYYSDLSLNYVLFLKINAVFFFLSALTILYMATRGKKKSIMEELNA